MKRVAHSFSEVGKFLKKARLRAKLSQADVKKILNYQSTQIISDWERGVCAAPHWALPILVKIYGIDIDKFIDLYLSVYEQELRFWVRGRK